MNLQTSSVRVQRSIVEAVACHLKIEHAKTQAPSLKEEVSVKQSNEKLLCACCQQPAGPRAEHCHSELEVPFARQVFSGLTVCQSCHEVLDCGLYDEINWFTVISCRADMLNKMASIVESDASQKHLNERSDGMEIRERAAEMRLTASQLTESLCEQDIHRQLKIKISSSGVSLAFVTSNTLKLR